MSMVKVRNLSYSYQHKELYNKISFTIDADVHCALIGSNGTGKSTLLNLLLHAKEDDYLYDGTIELDGINRIGYVSQFFAPDREETRTVFQYLSSEFVVLEKRIEALCGRMESAENLDEIFKEYEQVLDEFGAIDGDHYESNIKKQLKLAGLHKLENQSLDSLSGGEFKLIQVIRQMLIAPAFLIMDEPEVFLDFEHLSGLRNLINAHKGTLLVVTHNRYLLNHCFNKIIHMENKDIQEFEGSYLEYHFELLATKVELAEAAAEDEAEIERQTKILDKARVKATIMDNASLGKAVHARQTIVDRLKKRRTKAPFVELRRPEITFQAANGQAVNEIENEAVGNAKIILRLEDYEAAFDEQLLEHVNLTMNQTDHVAVVGRNGTGKTTMLREIYAHNKESVQLGEGTVLSMFSQVTGDLYEENKTLIEILGASYEEEVKRADLVNYLRQYGFEEETMEQKVSQLSGGEKDLFQLAVLSLKKANFLLLDEPTGHLDVFAQVALEQAIQSFPGAVLMVSHDFYTVANCVDYVFLVENNTVRKMSNRKFRQMIYANHFDRDYLLLEQEKSELEMKIRHFLHKKEIEKAKALLEPLEEIVNKMK